MSCSAAMWIVWHTLSTEQQLPTRGIGGGEGNGNRSILLLAVAGLECVVDGLVCVLNVLFLSSLCNLPTGRQATVLEYYYPDGKCSFDGFLAQLSASSWRSAPNVLEYHRCALVCCVPTWIRVEKCDNVVSIRGRVLVLDIVHDRKFNNIFLVLRIGVGTYKNLIGGTGQQKTR